MNIKKMRFFKKIMMGALLTTMVGAFSVGVGLKLSAENAQLTSATENTVRPIDLFEENNQIVYQNNVATPDYFFNGYMSGRYNALLVENGIVREDQPASAGQQVVPDYVKSGLKVTFKAGKTPVEYKPIVDISECDSETPLMVFAPVAKTRGVRDVNTFTIKLQDADNEERFVSFVYTYKADRVSYSGLDYLVISFCVKITRFVYCYIITALFCIDNVCNVLCSFFFSMIEKFSANSFYNAVKVIKIIITNIIQSASNNIKLFNLSDSISIPIKDKLADITIANYKQVSAFCYKRYRVLISKGFSGCKIINN